jgi:AraC-like DNA-binding protein
MGTPLTAARSPTVTAAALESGFQSLRSFYRAFQAEFGCTPREYLMPNLTEPQ